MTKQSSTNVIETRIIDIKVDILISAIIQAIPEREKEILSKIPISTIVNILQTFAFLTGCSSNATTRGVQAAICRNYFELEAAEVDRETRINGKPMKDEERANESRINACIKAETRRRKRWNKTNKRGKEVE